MAELSLYEIERRIVSCETSIKELYSKSNKNEHNLVATMTTLNNMLETLGELKAAVESIKNRPATLWDKLLSAIIGAAASGLVTYLWFR